MSIQIDWIDRNATVDSFKIYRATTPILDGALPAPLTTVAGNVFTYLDTTAPRNTVYHYRIATVIGGVETLSANKPLANIPYSGPGPQKLSRGDYAFGVYGRLNIDDLFSPTEMVKFMGWTTANVLTTAKYWVKYVVNAKVYFIPDNALASSIPNGLRGIYAAGAMYGNDPTNTYMPTLTAQAGIVPQAKVINRAEHQFMVRLPGSRLGAAPATLDPANQVGGEWDQYIAPMFVTRATPGTIPQYGDEVFITSQYYYTKDAQTSSSTYVVCRSGGSIDGVFASGLGADQGAQASHFWKPVLELTM